MRINFTILLPVICMILSANATIHVVTEYMSNTVGTLPYAVQTSDPGDTIMFRLENTDSVFITEEMIIGKDLTIIGKNTGGSKNNVALKVPCVETFTCCVRIPTIATNRIFRITGGTVRLQNLIAIGGSVMDSVTGGAAGGVLHITGQATQVFLDKVTVCDGIVMQRIRKATTYGGGVYIGSPGTSVTMTECIISNNECISHMYASTLDTAYSYGGGIYNAGNLTISKSIIDNNLLWTTNLNDNSAPTKYRANGGGIYNTGNLIVDSSYITNNSCSSHSQNSISKGGGIYNQGIAKVTFSHIRLNISNSGAWANVTTNSAASYSYGGAIHNCYNGNFILMNSSVGKNRSEVSFSANPAYSLYSANAFGGGISNADSAVFIIGNVTIDSNSVKAESPQWMYSYGGGLYNNVKEPGLLSLTNATVCFNRSTCQYGNFTAPSKNPFAGAFYNKAGKIIVTNCTFVSNPCSPSKNEYFFGNSLLLNNIFSQDIDTVPPAVIRKDSTGYNNLWGPAAAIFDTSKPALADYGGFTQTIMLPFHSAASGNGVRTGLYSDNSFNAYSAVATWLLTDGNSVPADTAITEIQSDQRGVAIDSPYCIGAYFHEYSDIVKNEVAHANRKTALSGYHLQPSQIVVDIPAQTVSGRVPVIISFYDLKGALLLSRREALGTSQQHIYINNNFTQNVIICRFTGFGIDQTIRIMLLK